MPERLTLKKLSDDLEKLRKQMLALEERLEHKFAAGLESSTILPGPRTTSTITPGHQAGIDAEHYQRLIAEEAYLIAERRGFQGGDPSQDWEEAGKLVDYRLMHPGNPDTSTAKPRKKTARTAKKSNSSKKDAAKFSGSAKQ